MSSLGTFKPTEREVASASSRKRVTLSRKSAKVCKRNKHRQINNLRFANVFWDIIGKLQCPLPATSARSKTQEPIGHVRFQLPTSRWAIYLSEQNCKNHHSRNSLLIIWSIFFSKKSSTCRWGCLCVGRHQATRRRSPTTFKNQRKPQHHPSPTLAWRDVRLTNSPIPTRHTGTRIHCIPTHLHTYIPMRTRTYIRHMNYGLTNLTLTFELSMMTTKFSQNEKNGTLWNTWTSVLDREHSLVHWTPGREFFRIQ